jgi:hypothetical protein
MTQESQLPRKGDEDSQEVGKATGSGNCGWIGGNFGNGKRK